MSHLTVLCQHPDIGLSCVGCCGHFTTRKSVEAGIRRSTRRLQLVDSMDEFAFTGPDFTSGGTCSKLIEENGKVLCAVHPKRIGEPDLRKKICDYHYLCKTAYFFQEEWDKATQQKFVDFVKAKQLDWYDYSIQMDSGELLREFEDEYGTFV